jgi:hypothetical protein
MATDEQKVFRPSEVWENMLDARGGRTRLERITGFVLSETDRGASSRPDVTGGVLKQEWVVAMLDRLWVASDYRPGSMGFGVQVWNAEKRIKWNLMSGQVSAAPWNALGERARRRQLTLMVLYLFLTTRDVRPATQQVSVVAGGELSVTLDVHNTGRFVYTVNPQTYLPRLLRFSPALFDVDGKTQTELVDSMISQDFIFEWYQTVDGIVVPREIRNMGAPTTLEVMINPNLDETLFEASPAGATSVDFWRRWLRPGRVD